MTTVEMTSDLTVRTVRVLARDQYVADAARVSTNIIAENDPGILVAVEQRDEGLIRYLMKKRHGSPFEHTFFNFYVGAPLFVFREFQRHRIASYNEMSGRYTKMEPLFYTYPPERPLVQAGSGAHPELVHGDDPELLKLTRLSDERAAQFAWDEYQLRLDAGVANEVARSVLPLSLYSKMYVSMNARALMNFLSLRVDSEDATFETKPQWEINRVAHQMEAVFAEAMPATHEAFVTNGRVAP